MKTRLFIGNLASTVTEAELRDKFDSLLASHKGEAEVGDVEVRCKNENNYFGYVDVHLNQLNNGRNSDVGASGKFTGIPIYLRKYIDLMNNTKWKGSLIKVQLAKESFIDKLRKEQQENQKTGDFNRNGQMSAPEASHRRTNEEDNSERGRNQRQANDVIYQLSRSTERRNRGNNRFDQQRPDDNRNKPCGFEIVGNDVSSPNKPHKSSPIKNSSPSPKKEKKPSKKSKSSSSDDDSDDDDVKDGIPKFKGLLLCYPEGIPDSAPIAKPQEKEEIVEDVTPEETQIQQKLLSIAFNADSIPKVPKNKSGPILPVSPAKPGINFKKNKQQQSDVRRLQSFDKMKELKTQRKNVIQSALSTVEASAPVTKQRKMLDNDDEDGKEGEPSHKKSKMTLFDDEEDEDDNEQDENEDEDVFKVKKQFEGARGQKLLELKTRYGNDDRFRIDDRFKESDGEDEVEPMEQEKEKQFDILTDILGKVVSSTNTPTGKTGTQQKKGPSVKDSTLASVIMPRYDPEAEEENEEKDDDGKKKMEEEKKSSKKSAKDKKKEAAETEEKVVRSTEPATFKTVSNLKALFSSSTGDDDPEKTSTLFKAPAEPQQSSFSLLAAFGKTSDDKEGDSKAVKQAAAATTTKSSVPSSEAPRAFWQSNPFKYDSSDDEGENDSSKRKVSVMIKDKPSEKPAPSTLVVHGKTPFFFTAKDARFDGLDDYFLHYEDPSKSVNGEEGADGNEKKEPIEDFSVKRQELKSIVKAKIRNSRRKDEKRTLAIKRAIRKRKRKIHQKSKRFG